MKKFAALGTILAFSALVYCQPAEMPKSMIVGSSYPTPTGTGIPTITAGKYNTAALQCSIGQAFGNVAGQAGCLNLAADGGGALGTLYQTFGTCANRPSATGTNQLYGCTDLPVQYWDDPGSNTWKQFVTGARSTPPATAASFTMVGSVSMTQNADIIRMTSTSKSAPGDALIAASLPVGTAWEITLDATFYGDPTENTPALSLEVTNGTTSGTSQINALETFINTVSNTQYAVQAATRLVGTHGSGSALNAPSNAPMSGIGRYHVRLLNDTTNLHYQLSPDGYNWNNWYTGATPTVSFYGLGMGLTTGNLYSQATIYSLTNTTLNVSACTITAATTASPIVATVSGGCGAQNGDLVAVHNVGGLSGANTGTGTFMAGVIPVTVSGANVTLVGTSGSGTYTSGGTITVVSR